MSDTLRAQVINLLHEISQAPTIRRFAAGKVYYKPFLKKDVVDELLVALCVELLSKPAPEKPSNHCGSNCKVYLEHPRTGCGIYQNKENL